MKKLLSMLLVLAMILSMVACGGANTETEPVGSENEAVNDNAGSADNEGEEDEGKPYDGVVLEMATQLNEEKVAVLQALIDAYEEETGCVINLTKYPAADYENTMKTRMASKELPDLWETHGWSRLRYGEYLEPVQNEPWYQYQTEAAKGVLEGDGDIAYALCLTGAVTCNTWNLTACQAIGIDPYSIYTWEDFMSAMQKAIDAGVTPVANMPNGNVTANMAGVFVTYPDAYSADAQAQLDGTYDWESYRSLLQMWAKLLDMGALWEDCTTMDSATAQERLCAGESIVMMDAGGVFTEMLHDLVPDNEYVLTPIPATSADANQYVLSGEGYAVGVWNASKNKEAAMGFLAYMAENGSDLATANGGIPSLTSVSMGDSYYVNAANTLLEKFPNAVFTNMWDREWMPNGMWNVLTEAAGMLLNDWSEEGQDAIIAFLKQNYDEKYLAANG